MIEGRESGYRDLLDWRCVGVGNINMGVCIQICANESRQLMGLSRDPVTHMISVAIERCAICGVLGGLFWMSINRKETGCVAFTDYLSQGCRKVFGRGVLWHQDTSVLRLTVPYI